MTLAFNGNEVQRFAGQQPFPQTGAAEASLYPPSSRYHGLAVLHHTTDDERPIAYLDRRFLPDPANFADLMNHTIQLGDRLDNIAARYLGDPEQYWRIADANAAMQPEELTAEIGSRIRITLPEGIPGATRA